MRTGERCRSAGDAGWATELEIALVMETERNKPVSVLVGPDLIVCGIRAKAGVVKLQVHEVSP